MPQSLIRAGRWRRRDVLAAAAASLSLSGTALRASPAGAAGLTPLQLAGQRVIYSYPGLTPPQALLDSIRAGRAAGVIFFEENFADVAQLSAAIAQLRQARAHSPIRVPLLLMTDQEGGMVRRLPGAPVPSAKRIGESPDPMAAAVDAGVGAGRNLRRIGVNVNLAPVLDVYHAPGNFIDGLQRSYSDNPAVVAALGSAFIAAQQANGVAATAKHFPGLGWAAAGQNTDNVPVTVPVSLATLRSVDESPYPAAVLAGVKLIMLSWAVYPALDAHRPAGLSPTIVNQELRGRNGFRGVTITDALEAGALRAFGTTAQRAVAAASAGMDLILCSSRDTAQGEDATIALADAYLARRLDPAAFARAVGRVTGLRAGLR